MHKTILFLLIAQISGISIPFIKDVFLHTFSNPYITVRLNSSCEECLCQEFTSSNNSAGFALNCFSNRTCQFFPTFPQTYKIQLSAGSRLYFLQNQFPNASQCCMPNITDLLTRLQSAVPIVMNLTFQPGPLGYDEARPYEAAVAGWGVPILYWFNPYTMTFIQNFSIGISYSLAIYNNQTFTGINGVPAIQIRDSQTNNYLKNVTYPTLDSIRKLIFLNDGKTAIVSTQNNRSLTVFNVNSPLNYTLQQLISFPLSAAHGISKADDTLLYASSWSGRSIFSYKYENSTWISNVFVNQTATGDGSFLAVDDCKRVWFINTAFGLRIYDPSGVQIAIWNMSLNTSNYIYDFVLLPNYIVLVSHVSGKRIVHYDPQVTCL